MAIFFPLQGFFNAIIYLRPRYLKQKKENPDRSFICNWWTVIRNKNNLETRDNTEYSVSGSEKRRSFVSKISSLVGGRRLSSFLIGVEDQNDDGNGGGSGDLQDINAHSDDDSFNPKEDLQQIEEAAGKTSGSPGRGSVTFLVSAKNNHGGTTHQQE